MDKNTLILLGFLAGTAAAGVALPFFLKRPWLAVFLPWILPVVKGYLLVNFPATQVLDITVLTFIFLALFLVCGFALRKLTWDRSYTVLVLLHLAVAALLAVSYSWTTAPNYGFRKLGLFAIFNTICLILGVSVVRSTTDARKIALWFGILVFFMSISMLVSPSYMMGYKWQIRQTFAETSPGNAAYPLAVGAVCSFIWLERGKRFMFLVVPIWLVTFVATYKTGSRSMIVQLLIGTVILGLMYKGSNRKIRGAMILVVMLVAVPLLISYGRTVGGRILGIIQDPAYWLEHSERPFLWSESVKGFYQKPLFGHGVGAFAMNVKGADIIVYPHNFFLEVLYEGGLVCFVPFTLFWVLVGHYLFHWRRLNNRFAATSALYAQDLWIAVLVSAFVSAAVHWDISGQRLLWLLVGISLGTTRACNQEIAPDWEEDYYPSDADLPENGQELQYSDV
ncbi:MAG: O-antigen ligase family protein [Sedimentisphaerales bacterium]|nr:O-antigen ligase family protein [Sedimentisphaerales bacterium]